MYTCKRDPHGPRILVLGGVMNRTKNEGELKGEDIYFFKVTWKKNYQIKYKEIEAEKVETADGETEVDWQIKTISWQEKHFSKNEREFYGDALNCVTDLEKRYHEQIKDQESPEDGPDIFTFTEEDGYTFEQELFGSKINYLQNLVEIANASKDDFQQDHEEFDYNKHLQSSMENKVISSNVEKMYIMADLGEYVENIWIKNEQLLCSMKYDKNSQVLNIYPDFTTIKPYYLKMGSETIRYFFYFIENCSEISEELVLKEQEIIKKISEHKQSIRQRLIGNKFPLPPKNKLYVYLFLEILSGKHFEYPDVYIEYYIDLPEGWSCENSENLRGRTQTSHGITDKYLLHFGHCVDVVLQYNIQKLSQTGVPKTPYIYFEIISKGTWDRYRTEGLTYKILPISEPGHHIYNLSCFRFTQGAWGDLRRFFIGDCKNYKDVTWIGIPKEHEGVVINKFGINTLGTERKHARFVDTMVKKGFNWKARKVVDTVIDNSDTQKIQVDIDSGGNYDQSNQLVLPSKKRKTKIKTEKVTRILSKKHRKRLEKIVEKKKKKENRASLLESLQKVRATNDELSQLTSIAAIQTKGLKRYFQEELNPEKVKPKRDLDILSGEAKLNSISGAKRRKLLDARGEQLKNIDPNVVGFEKSDTETSDSELEENGCEEEARHIEDDTKKENMGDKGCEEENNEAVVLEEKISPIVIKDDVKASNIENKKSKPKKVPSKPAVYVDVIRNEEIQTTRLKLPILAEEQQIMEVINENSVVIIAGETGSGKTTQVPQFLYEAGYALKKQIAVTEPRRVAAISMSRRVAQEMNLSTKEVSYLIRFEGNVTEDTKIKFMTDGVLLKEVQNDFLLSKYSVVILDEAHERSVYTDILIGLLSRIVPLRHKKGDPLKLIIMSATLRLEDFTLNRRLFKNPPPVIKVEARQFPVTVHFNKRTNENYLKDAFNKAIKINTKLPEGGILIFVTGQQEVNSLVSKLRKAFPLRHKEKILEKSERMKKDAEENGRVSEDEDVDEGMRRALHKKRKLKIIPEINLDDYSVPGDTEHKSDEELSEDEEDSDTEVTTITNAQPLWTLPLYSLLPSHKQQKVFAPPPPGCRLCIVSTNVAETSLTIPSVKYVIDTGKAKIKLYDKVTGVTSYVVHWTSKASADQRAGRAGRVGPGHSYRLYSSAVFNDVFQEYSVPEIQQKPVDDLYLQMKCMNIDKVVNFPFPTAPDLLQLKTAESRLESLGALKNGQVTPLGRAISKFPLLPRYGKMLALSHQQNLLPYTICLVAALSVQEVLLEVPIVQTSLEARKQIRQKWSATRHQWAGQGNSLLLGDNMVLLKAVGAAEYANSQGRLEKFCNDNGLRQKAVVEIRKLRVQLTNEIKNNVPEAEIVVDPKLEPPTDLQAKLLRQILLAGMGDQIAKKIPPEEVKEGEDKAKFKYAYQANNMEDPVFLHQGSVLKKSLPEFVVYQEIYETNKMYMRGVTAIEPEWLATYVPSLCNLSEPLFSPEPRYNPATGKVHCTVSGTFGPQAWPLPHMEIVYPASMDAYKWFARYLLEGKVFPRLEKYVTALLSPANIMVKSWARLQPRTEALLKALLNRDCCSKKVLGDIWSDSPQYLLAEYLKWLPESAHGEVSLLWPPLDSKVS